MQTPNPTFERTRRFGRSTWRALVRRAAQLERWATSAGASTMNGADVNVRSYTPQDRVACLAIFDGNTPDFFAPFERAEFAAYLDTASANYLVLETATGVIIGCGGYYVKPVGGVAGLAWGMVDRAWHKRGFGRVLLEARLALLRSSPDAELVRVNTSQNSRGFFERCGFRVLRVVPSGYAQGIDRVESELALR